MAIVFPKMVTNCFGLDILRIILLRGILDLLIKSKLFSVHRRVLVCFLDTFLRLNAKTVPTS